MNLLCRIFDRYLADQLEEFVLHDVWTLIGGWNSHLSLSGV
jgi:hypothetical protein